MKSRKVKSQLIIWLCISMLCGFSFSAFAQDRGTVKIDITHVVGDLPLILDSTIYKNSFAQDFRLSKFRYYVGRFELVQANGKTNRSKYYFLVDEEEKASKKLLLENIPYGTYTSLRFILGVDSASNCSGAQSGALDPINAMFWTWNSGYIFLKLEGISSASALPGHILEYHLGGYKQPCSCIRTIDLKLDSLLLNETKSQKTIDLQVDVLKILTDQYPVDFTKLPSVTDFHHATDIADNYKSMFSIPTSKHEN